MRHLMVVAFLMGAVPSTASAQASASASSAPATVANNGNAAEPIGPWFVSALPEKAPEESKLNPVAQEAVNACPGKAVVCEPVASGDLEDSQWNRVFAKRRLDACIAAVEVAGGTPTASGGYLVGPSGPNGRGVQLSCATIPVHAALQTLPTSQRPVTEETLPEAIRNQAPEAAPSQFILGVGGFGSLGTGDGVNLAGAHLTPFGYSKGRFVARANVGFGTSEHGAGGYASLMPGFRITNWLDASLGPVASASFVDGLQWTSQYFVGAGLGLGFNWSVLRLQVTPQYGAEVDRFQHQAADGRFRLDANLGVEFWY